MIDTATYITDDTLLTIGDVISFDVSEWQPEKGIHSYYDEYSDSVQLPQWFTVIPANGNRIIKKYLHGYISLDPRIYITPDDQFRIIRKQLIDFSTPPTSMGSRDGGSFSGYSFLARSIERQLFARFHFHSGYTTSIRGVYKV